MSWFFILRIFSFFKKILIVNYMFTDNYNPLQKTIECLRLI